VRNLGRSKGKLSLKANPTEVRGFLGLVAKKIEKEKMVQADLFYHRAVGSVGWDGW